MGNVQSIVGLGGTDGQSSALDAAGTATAALNSGICVCFGDSHVNAVIGTDTDVRQQEQRRQFLTQVLTDITQCAGLGECRHWPRTLTNIASFIDVASAYMNTLASDNRHRFDRDPGITTLQLAALRSLTNDFVFKTLSQMLPLGVPEKEHQMTPIEQLAAHKLRNYLRNDARLLAFKVLANIGICVPLDVRFSIRPVHNDADAADATDVTDPQLEASVNAGISWQQQQQHPS